jgi:hypothetical protein
VHRPKGSPVGGCDARWITLLWHVVKRAGFRADAIYFRSSSGTKVNDGIGEGS